MVIDVPALQFGLLRLGQKASCSIQIRNISQLSAVWHLRESPLCLAERHEDVSGTLQAPWMWPLHGTLTFGSCLNWDTCSEAAVSRVEFTPQPQFHRHFLFPFSTTGCRRGWCGGSPSWKQPESRKQAMWSEGAVGQGLPPPHHLPGKCGCSFSPCHQGAAGGSNLRLSKQSSISADVSC